jgi:hypothetical protein
MADYIPTDWEDAMKLPRRIFITAEIEKWGKVVKFAGIKPE